MFAIFIAAIVLIVIAFISMLPVTIRLRFVFGPKEQSFRWQIGLAKNLIHREYDFIPKDKIEAEVQRKGTDTTMAHLQKLLKKMRFWQVDAFVLLGVGNACYTALCCGLLDATLNALGSVFLPKGKKGRGWLVQTEPSFDDKALEAQIHGIFRISFVQIILAALAWRKEKDRRN